MSPVRPVVLLVLDGWGIAPAGPGNPIAAANLANFRRLSTEYPAMALRASGDEVGLSWGEMGNSEVGHLTIGTGRVHYQSYPRISLAVQTGEFFQNQVLINAINHAVKNNGAVHLVGLVSPGNVHGSNEHLHALIALCHRLNVKKVFVHAILDGRDIAQDSALTFIAELEQHMAKEKVGQLASLSGRFFAMDRDNHWERTSLAYQAMTGLAAKTTTSAKAAIEASYAEKVFDEQFVPTTIVDQSGQPVGQINSGDSVIMTNFRADRGIQLSRIFTEPDFKEFSRPFLTDLKFVSFTKYSDDSQAEIAFPADDVPTCLAKVVSDAGLAQLHVAETEKYAHVTYFLNGQREAAYPLEERVIIPSLRVDSYAQAPQMSALEITDAIIAGLESGKYALIVANFANADMVGHTGDFDATKTGVEVVDQAIGRIEAATLAKNGALLITGDHGNGEEVKNLRTGEIDKEHSTNVVPLLVIGAPWKGEAGPSGPVPEDGDLSLLPVIGMLADVAPTVLSIMGLSVPPEMTGTPLV